MRLNRDSIMTAGAQVRALVQTRSRLLLLLPALALASACGGTSSGAPVTSNPPPGDGGTPNYTGPVARTADVAAFKLNVWDNLVRADRCGACHGTGGQAPAFVRNDDINLAYNTANTVVNLRQPDTSQMVSKLLSGHHCWEGSGAAADQACADQLTVWISNWAGQSLDGGAQGVEFVAPPIRDAGGSRALPASPALFEAHVWPLLRSHCAACHAPNAAGTPISPFFASADLDAAYAASRTAINLDTPVSSRLVVRLVGDAHNCWSDCSSDGETLRAAIQAMADEIDVAAPDDALVLSKALRIEDGVLAASGGRHDSNIIARYEFRSGMGNTAFDTSGVEPALNLALSGDVEWVGGWGIRINDGKAQGATATSAKLQQLITSSGEFTFEAWVIAATPAQQNAHILSYSAGGDSRNATLSQQQDSYAFALRHNNTSGNGEPLLDSPPETLQASLQHVVLTYDAVNGRRIYVNGVNSGIADPVAPALLDSWNDTHALVLGNEASGNRLWQGVIRFAGIHNRALSPAQVADHFAAGVGERFYLLFSISDLINTPESYIGLEVSRFDNYGYLFAEPFFINLDGLSPPATDLAGMRIGINGREVAIGQTWTRLTTQIGGPDYDGGIQPLSRLGTVIGLDRSQEEDEFFLTFAQLGSHSNVYTEPVPIPQPAIPAAPQPHIGLRTFDEINATMSVLTGVPSTYGDVPETFNLVRQQLPVNHDIGGFVTAHQIGIAQLAIEYCNALVEAEVSGDADVPVFFSNVNYGINANTIADQDWHDNVITPLLSRMLGNGLDSQPAHADVRAQLADLLLSTDDIKPVDAPDGVPDGLARCGGACPANQTQVAVKAACATALGGATMLIK
ncbi:LamG domain-containing protein [Alcanivorax limicola]|uniref:LamG domain-containing protein n=1 Tax=Alcanivorax limicola TaxID=2874102 RepID=UPI001CBB665C|nr:LamG domain-containing protein [Alcanivorax limicola]